MTLRGVLEFKVNGRWLYITGKTIVLFYIYGHRVEQREDFLGIPRCAVFVERIYGIHQQQCRTSTDSCVAPRVKKQT